MARAAVWFARGIGKNAWDVNGGYRVLMRDARIRDALFQKAEEIHRDAGGNEAGFVLEVQEASGRRRTPRAAIIAATFEARQAEATDRTLTRAFEKNRES